MGSKPAYQRTIAEERIRILFNEAAKQFRTHPERSHRYVEIARNIAMKFNLSMPDDLKERFCPDCYRYWVPGENVFIRVKSGVKIYRCQECGEVTRKPFPE